MPDLQCAPKLVFDLLKPFGFRKRKSAFRRELDQVVQIISLQKNQWSARFTANIAVASKRLLERQGRSLTTWDEAQCHVRVRIGTLAEGRDVWWDFETPEQEEKSAEELCRWLAAFALPGLEEHRFDADLTRSQWLRWFRPEDAAFLEKAG